MAMTKDRDMLNASQWTRENPRVVMENPRVLDYKPEQEPESDGDDERDYERGGGGGDATMGGFVDNAVESKQPSRHDSEPESGGRTSSLPDAHDPRCVNMI